MTATILVVEDSLTDMKIISLYLEQAGYVVISAKSGEEAQEKIDVTPPNLIFTDVILPGKSGFELCREIKTSFRYNQIPVILCSTKDTELDRLWGSMLGADAYLTKPINQKELIITLKRLTQKENE
ncbi:MAG: response regulator transcription factor [Nostoc sp. DedVER02]|uniref:response regulator transcription factor n=1 Tax=unclassified Nostoc TaxID=2593658 RepID=UPI002AD57345|nr:MULTISPECIES: response regulator [unclassified Nostoc]MDZ7984760.1 response regulator [Nostoc sp. DedVER02]MDZ8115351.1 response regulator [Nostoc sp. DedVER01b]